MAAGGGSAMDASVAWMLFSMSDWPVLDDDDAAGAAAEAGAFVAASFTLCATTAACKSGAGSPFLKIQPRQPR